MWLPALVAGLAYRPGWEFRLEYGPTSAAGCQAAQVTGGAASTPTAAVSAASPGGTRPGWSSAPTPRTAATPGRRVRIEHPCTVPPDEPLYGWHRWLLDCCLAVDRPEGCGLFRIHRQAPFFPQHGPRARLYDIIDRGLDLEGMP